MAAEILASSLINTVRFKIDFSSYRQSIKAITKVRDEMKKLNNVGSGISNVRASSNTIRAARRQAADLYSAQVDEFRKRQKQQPMVENRIGAKSSAFGFESEKMTRLKPNEIAQYSAKVKLLNYQYRSGSLPLIQYNERMRQLTGSMRSQNAESLTLMERLKSARSQLLFVGLTGGMALKSLAETGKDLENTGIMMTTVFGDQVGPQMQFLRDQSNRLGISFQDSAKSFSQMMFAGQQAGMGVGEMQDIFLGVTEASKVFGMSQDETAGSMRAIIQMFSKGTVQAEELRGQLGDRLVGAYNIAATAMGMTTEELGKQLKAGKILAKDMVPKLAKALRELAAPGLEKALKSLTTTEQRMLNTWMDFKNQIFTSGLGTFLQGLYTTFSNLLIMMKPLANILGGIFDGVQDILYPVQYAIALFLDWAEAMGYLDSTTQNWSKKAQNAFKQVGEVIGWVFGVWGISKIGGMVSGLLGMLSVIGKVRTAFMGMLGAEAAVSAAGVAATGTGAATTAAGAGLGAIALPSIITGALAYPMELLKQTKVDRTQNPEMMALDLAAKKQAEYQRGTYGSTGYGVGSAIPQTVPITLDIKVTGDAMTQHFTKELGNNTTAQ